MKQDDPADEILHAPIEEDVDLCRLAVVRLMEIAGLLAPGGKARRPWDEDRVAKEVMNQFQALYASTIPHPTEREAHFMILCATGECQIPVLEGALRGEVNLPALLDEIKTLHSLAKAKDETATRELVISVFGHIKQLQAFRAERGFA